MENKQERTPTVSSLSKTTVIDVCTNAKSFDTFLRAHLRGLVQFLRPRTASEQDAEDAAQESMTKLLRYRDAEPPTAWKRLLYRIAVNVAHDQFRVATTHHHKEHVTFDKLDVPTTEQTPEQYTIYQQRVGLISKAILELPPKCQRVYLLKRIHDLSHTQIAELCGISIKMVEKHLTTALAQLRRKVGDLSTDTSE